MATNQGIQSLKPVQASYAAKYIMGLAFKNY